MSIVMDFIATDPRLEQDIPYDESIGQNPLTLAMFSAKASKVTLSAGRVSAIADRSAYGYVASQLDAGKRPAWEATGGPSGRSGCLLFDNARLDQMATNVVVPTGSGAEWTKAIVLKVPGEATANQYRDNMSGSTVPNSGTGAHRLAVRGVNLFAAVVGTTSVTVSRTVTQIADEWCLLMCSWHGPSNTIALSVNGGAWSTATAAGAQCTDPVLNLGAVGGSGGAGTTMIGRAADFALFGAAMHDPNSDELALLNLYKQYIVDAHDLALN